jgi:hypothetical protein
MAKKQTTVTPPNNVANQKNSNKGTSGTNKQYQAALDNRANQLNPNNANYKATKTEEKTEEPKK